MTTEIEPIEFKLFFPVPGPLRRYLESIGIIANVVDSGTDIQRIYFKSEEDFNWFKLNKPIIQSKYYSGAYGLEIYELANE